MSAWELVVVALAGVAAGAINAVVGSGTLITFPTLVAFGIPPVSATMSNAIGLVAGGVSGTWGYRRELSGQWPQLKWQIPASFLGALLGCFLLMHLPEKVFESVVPVLLVGALILVVAQPAIGRWAAARVGVAEDSPRLDAALLTPGRIVALAVATFAVGVYGGYFTAAQGILLVGVMGVIVPGDLQRMNAAKNLLSLIVNVVAALTYTFVAVDRINWVVAGLIAIGSLAGGVVGARYGRRLTPTVLRAVIVVVGLIGLWRLMTT
ncbi:sulfite exporter TauE/SafE family protein [Gordonia sp. TBRC 11910]|uniref:Probable membrane transporter protein n=1 Tax=Gordonia asplenii TaxID=2725283 RepID=A0A848L747_9ACTN|nr:sulfite exporter TauE/SafE family protein [Gordonia asplenii]NMO04523.1 sulfite exporter TauE/SafE family protein [Gordonia asplenii]